ncbi:MAG: hypothetical protein C5S52_06860 [ANME-2 cluster archaeon]|nr:hypothetical protein [ANME-2 cluster archaeon]
MRLDQPQSREPIWGLCVKWRKGRMSEIVKAEIYFDGEYYCARTLNIDVFTQGRTIDEAIENLKEAVSLHLEDEVDHGLQEVSSILAMVEAPPTPLPPPFPGAKGLSASLSTLLLGVPEFATERAGLLPQHNIPCLSGCLYPHPYLPSDLRSRQCCGCPRMPKTLRANRSPLVTGHVGWIVSYFLA